MTTTAVTPTKPQAVNDTTNTTSERFEVAVGYDLSKDEKGQITREPSFMGATKEDEQAAIKKLADEGKFEYQFTVTVSIPRAKNLAGIKEICPNEEEAANNFNRGAKQKANNRLKALLTEVDADGKLKFDPSTDLVNNVLDMREEIASESKRKVLTEEEKLDRFLADFPEAMRAAMKSAYLAQRGAAAPAA